MLAAAFVIIAAVLAGLDVGGLRGRLTGGGQAWAVRLAVLPFANLTGNPEEEYLSDGFTQEMIAQLGRLHPQSLSVIARTSVMRYKKTDKPIDQIGRELRVDYILEGSAQREADRVRISAALIKVLDQTQPWADRYERELAGILMLQSEVAQKVAGALALTLLPAEQARLANARTVNPEAYDACSRGSYHWQKLTRAEPDTAQQYFDLALKKDPDYALSYAGIAIVWGCRQQMGITPPREAGPKAKAAALERGLVEAGYEGAQRRIADVLATRYEKSGRMGAVSIALRYFDGRDYVRTIDWLEKACEDRDPNLPYIGKPLYDPLRSNPRFQSLLKSRTDEDQEQQQCCMWSTTPQVIHHIHLP
jgi:TolB-like protein